MRGISDSFIDSLLSGQLKFFLDKVKSNGKLYALAIRDGYINIYYRGGNLLKITQNKKGYKLEFDKSYCIGTTQQKLYDELCKVYSYDINFYINNFDNLQRAMDEWFALYAKNEREFQHNLLFGNSCIVDIEYGVSRKSVGIEAIPSMRFDMLAVLGDKLLIVENKYGNGAVTGKAGISKHYNDVCAVLSNEQLYDEMLQSVQNIANNRYRLGLSDNCIDKLDKTKTEIVFLFANYNQRSSAIQAEVAKMHKQLPAKVLFVDSMQQGSIDFSQAKDIFSL